MHWGDTPHKLSGFLCEKEKHSTFNTTAPGFHVQASLQVCFSFQQLHNIFEAHHYVCAEKLKEVVATGSRLNIGYDVEGGIKNEAKAAGLHDRRERETLSTDIVKM